MRKWLDKLQKLWYDIRDNSYKFKVWFGLKFLGWHRPENYEYGYFVDPTTAVLKRRDKERIMHTTMIVYGDKGVRWN